MKQVWQTLDGAIFNDPLAAQQWEDSQGKVKDLADLIARESCRIDEEDALEIVETILAHYDVSPK